MREKTKNKNIMIVGILLAAVSGILAACGTAGTGQNDVVQPTFTEGHTVNTDVPSTEVVQVEEGTPSGDTESPAPPVPTARVGLESTDPGTVNLASGEVQLIEAFAFW